MIERIERVARVKAVEYDTEHPFRRKEGYEGSNGNRFAQVLKDVMRQGKRQESTMPEPYRLDITTRATHSLFYQNGLDLRRLEAQIHGNG